MRTPSDTASIDRTARAVVYPANSVSGYGHIRSLARAGIRTVGLSARPCHNFRSRYLEDKQIVPDPLEQHERFLEWLLVWGARQEQPPALFMAEDVYAYIASLYQHELKPYFRYPFIPIDSLPSFFSKDAMYAAAEAAGLNVPRTMYSPKFASEVAGLRYPLVIKPLVSRFTFNSRRLVETLQAPRMLGGKARQVDTSSAFAEIVSRLSDAGIAFCVQELIPGENARLVNVKLVAAQDGSVPMCFISRKVRQQPADFGTCAVARADYVPELNAMAEAFCRTTGYSGPAGFEFKWDERDQRWMFIEMNPRLDFWIGMAALHGVNLPLQQYRLSTGQTLLSDRQRNAGPYWIDVVGDLKGLRWRRQRPEWQLTASAILRPYLRFNEAVFNWDDPLPGLSRLIGFLPRAAA